MYKFVVCPGPGVSADHRFAYKARSDIGAIIKNDSRFVLFVFVNFDDLLSFPWEGRLTVTLQRARFPPGDRSSSSQGNLFSWEETRDFFPRNLICVGGSWKVLPRKFKFLGMDFD
jgi:hypothetical protein